MSGANDHGERHGAKLDGKNLRGALGGERDQKPRGPPYSGHCLHDQPNLLHLLQCGMLISKPSPCTAVR